MNIPMTARPSASRRSAWPHLLVWLPMGLLLALWSLLAWGSHALAGWSGWAAWAGGSGSDWRAWVEALVLPPWLEPWLPAASLEAAKAMLLAAAPWMEAVVARTPELLSWLPTLVLVVWAVGAVFLVLAGVVASVAIRVWRGRGRVQPALGPAR